MGKIFENRSVFQETGPKLPEVGKNGLGELIDLDIWSIPQPKKHESYGVLEVTFEADRHYTSNFFAWDRFRTMDHGPFNAEDYIALSWVAPL